MKHFKILILALFLFTSCSKKYIQVFQTQSNILKLVEDSYVYENDTIRVSYNLWAEKGALHFQIENKLEVPLYVNWANSSVELNNQKFIYASEFNNTKQNQFLSEGKLSATDGTTFVIPLKEKLSELQPHAQLDCFQFVLFPESYFEMKEYGAFDNYLEGSAAKFETLYQEDFSSENTAIKIKNCISVSLSKETNNKLIEHFIYVSSIKEMTEKYFKGKYDSKTKRYCFPYKNPTSFYRIIPAKFSLDYKNKSMKRK